MAADAVQRCILAGELCAAACEVALAADPSYTSPGTERYSEAHLAVVSCAAVCTLLVKALQSGDADLELVRWCAETCAKCAEAAPPDGMPAAQWQLVAHACDRCARDCHALAEGIARSARDALDAHRDTDFQSLLER